LFLEYNLTIRNKGWEKTMATTIYMIRHGESRANEKDVFIGHTDLALTDRGQQQAALVAEYLKDIRPDAIYSSDLQRAYHTALATAEPLGMTPVTDQGLREIYAGQWENVPFSVLQQERKAAYGIWLNHIAHARCEGGESVPEVSQRVVETVTRLARQHENGVIFLFSHATPVRTFALHCMGKPIEELECIPWPSNASVTKAELDGQRFRLLEYSVDHFMGKLATRLPYNV